MARVITSHVEPGEIRQAMVEIIGQTLDVDRTLIFDVRFDEKLAIGLCEWLNPVAARVTSVLATYPISVFLGGAEHIYASRTWLESHADNVHDSFMHDGSADVLHKDMAIASLLWFPFDFEENRFFVLVFNQVRHKRRWTDADMNFAASVAELVSMAELKGRLESERRQREQQSEQRQRLEGLGLLARGVAHDFNNLLTAILGNAGMAARHVSEDGPLRTAIANVESAATTAANMCRQLLTYSGRASTEGTLLDLSTIVVKMVEILDASLGDNITVCTELASHPLWVKANGEQLQQVVLNLLTNAAEASLDGAGNITIRTGTTTKMAAPKGGSQPATSLPAGDLPFLAVQDTGAGMDEATVAKVFEPFFTTKQAGHGLGLATVHGICTSHRASISIQSALGTGTTVTVVFPPGVDAPRPMAALAEESHRTERILVVDDAEIIRVVCESALTLGGLQVTTTGSGAHAIDLCKADPGFDLVVLDLNMPGMNGRQTHAALREAGHQFPIVMISALDVDGVLGSVEGPTSFLQKPFRPTELLAVVDSMLQQPRYPAAGAQSELARDGETSHRGAENRK